MPCSLHAAPCVPRVSPRCHPALLSSRLLTSPRPWLPCAVLQASSPLELGVLVMMALWLASWVLDRHARAASVLSSLHLRVLGAAWVHTAELSRAGLGRAAAATVAEQPGSGPRAAAEPPSPQPSPGAARRGALGPPLPPAGKDISSFRLPDHAIAGSRARRRAAAAATAGRQQPRGQAAKQQLRWSMDAAGGQPRRHHIRTQPKPRTSVDFDPSPASPARHTRRVASLAEHRASPLLDAGSANSSGTEGVAQQLAQAPARESRRWQPSMQRIASGQELAELAAASGAGSARSSLDAASGCTGVGGSAPQSAAGQPKLSAQAVAEQPAPGASEGAAHPAAGSDADASSVGVAAAAAVTALSSWLPSISLTWPASPGAAEAASASGAIDPSDPGASPFSPTSAAAAAAAAAVARRVAESGTAAAAWASSTVDSVLRPLIPAGGTAGGALLWRSPSASGTSGGGGDTGSAVAAAAATAASAHAPLEHAASAPLPRAASAAESALDGLSGQAFASVCLAACAAAEQAGRPSLDLERRRMSLDGVSARHYSSGAVVADPSRWGFSSR